MSAIDSHIARRVCLALACAAVALCSLVPARARALSTIECQHPVLTGVEIYRLHHITSRRACPVALALFRWDDTEGHEPSLYGCHGMLHPYLRLHSFHGWHLALTPDFVMSRRGASFAVTGTDFPINCT